MRREWDSAGSRVRETKGCNGVDCIRKPYFTVWKTSPCFFTLSGRMFYTVHLKNADGMGLAYAGRRCSVKDNDKITETR